METDRIIEGWLRFQGLSIAQLKRDNREAHIALARREVMEYLRAQGWTLRKIGEFLDRDVSTIKRGLHRPNTPWLRRHNHRYPQSGEQLEVVK